MSDRSTLSSVMFHDREEMEMLAGAVESLAMWLHSPEVRRGATADRRESLEQSRLAVGGFCEDLLDQADRQEREREPEEVALDRRTIKFACNGVLHAFDALANGRETVMGEGPHETLAALSLAFWEFVGVEERAERDAIHSRVIQRQTVAEQMEKLLGSTPDEWLAGDEPPVE